MATKRKVQTTKAGKKVKVKAAKRQAQPKKYAVKVKLNGRNKIGYLTDTGTVDTDAEKAGKWNEKIAEQKAYDFFESHKRLVYWIQLVAVPKQ